MKKIIANQTDMLRSLDRMAHQILENYSDTSNLCLIGIKTRGVYLANRLQERIKKFAGITLPVGVLDITWYRDDLSKVAEDPQIKPSSVGFDIQGKNLIVVDDVLYTGRTVRSALDAITDLGRPRKVELLVMVDRGHREIPVKADYIGREVITGDDDIIHVHLVEKDGDDCIVHNIGGQLERENK